MKKSKLTKSIVTSFIAALALTACGEVTKSDKAIVTFTGSDGKEIQVITSEMFEEYMSGKTHVSSFYDKVLEVLIRNDFEKGSRLGLTTTLSLETIKARAEEDVKKQEELAKSNAKTNGTTTGDEWDAILEGEGVDDRAGLVQKYIYKYEKEQLEDAFAKANEDTLAEQFIGIDKDGNAVYDDKVTGLPYHISHILIKAENSSNDFTRDTISADQAKLLGNVFQTLASGLKTFNGTAAKFSEDSSSDVFGDVGIVTNSASANGSLTMVPEFQLGIYAYDNIISHRTTAEGVCEGLGLWSQTRRGQDSVELAYQDVILENEGLAGGLSLVPYRAITEIAANYDVEKNKDDTSVGSGSANLYPRNVIWNQFLNKHQAFVFTNIEPELDLVKEYGDTPKHINAILKYQKTSTGLYKFLEYGFDASGNFRPTNYNLRYSYIPEKIDDMPGFVDVKDTILKNVMVGENLKVLVDEDNNPIFGVRSTYGIHLIKIVKSINDFAIEGGKDDENVSLEEYYTTEVPTYDAYGEPNNDKFPQYNGEYKQTYVNFIDQEDKSVFTSRAETVESKIKSFDSTYTYMLYEALVDAYPGLKFHNNINELIDNYIEIQRGSAVVNQAENMQEAWSSYIELLEAQGEARSLSAQSSKKGLIPGGCMTGFGLTDSLTSEEIKALYEKGGACYYGE